jgi:hypothetical protein
MSLRICLFALLVAGCDPVHEVHAVYPGGGPDNGALEIVLTRPTARLTVAVGNKIVVDRETSGRAHIEGVPAGPQHVRVVTAGGCEHSTHNELDIDVPPNGIATVPLPGPEEDHGCGIESGLLYIGLSLETIAIVALAEVAHQTHIKSR